MNDDVPSSTQAPIYTPQSQALLITHTYYARFTWMVASTSPISTATDGHRYRCRSYSVAAVPGRRPGRSGSVAERPQLAATAVARS